MYFIALDAVLLIRKKYATFTSLMFGYKHTGRGILLTKTKRL